MPTLPHSLRRRFVAFAGSLMVAACASPRPGAPAPAPIVTDRPDFTESAVTVPHRSTQVEMGGTWSREQGVRSVSSGETLIRHGLSPRVELRITGASYAVERSAVARSQGLEDSGIGFKLALHDGGDAPALVPTLGLIVGTSLPTGAANFRSRRALPESKLLAAWTLHERIGFASNLNWARAEDSGEPHDEFSGSGSFAFALTDRVGAYAEYFAFGERMARWQRREYVNGGVTFLLHPTLQLDLRAGLRADRPRDGTFVGIGLSRRY